ncbi:type I-E CRISPR-associated protein Cse2/CasB [Streptomyces deccanensis]|uniref:type I-E CRISPR-associated protein Cse2/CasB n=1 Tax=Streptomyces deccanensis TaxID=424188 RepID=UPI001EFABEEB|nr:type I-E CRISPR-associated protein Cse2/CasB [Streptomyces deccanensis]ULR48557.1 type I-E CRISPR-associated protein Cse2/CasB [Streptomyces deccanensis]
MTTPPPAAASPPLAAQRPSDAFVAYVLDLCANKQAQSALRSGLGRPAERCNRLHRYLVRRLPERMHPDARRAHYAVAALIAARPRSARALDAERAEAEGAVSHWYARANLGASLAHAVNAQIIKPGSAEGDLHLYSRQSSEALNVRLPAMTRHLLSGGIAVDWAVLLEDLTWWDRDRDRVATRWLESYFRTLHAETADDAAVGSHTDASSTDLAELPEENFA